MIRLVVLLAIIATLAYLPLNTFDSIVLPELASLKQFYGNSEAVAEQVLQN